MNLGLEILLNLKVEMQMVDRVSHQYSDTLFASYKVTSFQTSCILHTVPSRSQESSLGHRQWVV